MTHVNFDAVYDVRRFLWIRLGHKSIKLLVLPIPFDRVQQRAFQLEIASEHGRFTTNLIPRYYCFYRQPVT